MLRFFQCVFELDSITKYYFRDSLGRYERTGLGVPNLSRKNNKDTIFFDYKVLNTDDDVASCNWGMQWRMPTITEIKELIGGCEWIYTPDFNGTKVKGYVGTSKVNGNVIFLPAVGEYQETSIFNIVPSCSYWSSSLYNNPIYNSDSAYTLLFSYDYIDWFSSSRESGLSVRAVVK